MILWATAENLHRDHVFGGGDRNRRSAQVRGLHPRAEQFFKPGATKHDVSVDARREMNERKNAGISDEVCVGPTQLEAVPFQGFDDRRYGVVASSTSNELRSESRTSANGEVMRRPIQELLQSNLRSQVGRRVARTGKTFPCASSVVE